MTAGSLAGLLAEAAAAIPGCTATDAEGSMTWAIGRGAAFAALSGETAEFRLDPVIGSAARRTPDATPSLRGAEWVAFHPGVLDEYAVDRAGAWFAAAARRAAVG
jgi:hypothetical protein